MVINIFELHPPQNNQVGVGSTPTKNVYYKKLSGSSGPVGNLHFSVDGAAVGLELEKVFQRSHCSRVAVSCDSYLINLD